MKQVEVDIVVIGAGVAGFSAALSAHQKQKSVLLIDRAGAIGGNAIQSNVGTICGTYYRTNSDQIKEVEHPMVSLVIKSLDLKPKLLSNGLIVNPYDVDLFNQFIKETLEKASHIDLWLSARIMDVRTEKDVVKSIEVKHDNEVIEVSASSFIDTSGNGILYQLLGAPMLKSKTYQSASQVFEVSGVDSSNEFGLNMSIAKASRGEVNKSQLPNTYLSCSLIPGSLRENKALIKFTIPHQITDETEVAVLANLGAKGASELFILLKNQVESMRDASLERVFPLPGIRIQQRARGKTILTKEQILGMKKHADSVAKGTWPIEIWSENGSVKMEYFETNGYYDIPKGCICSHGFSNMFMAGKNISATDEAIASARVIGTCLQTGFAAGLLASQR